MNKEAKFQKVWEDLEDSPIPNCKSINGRTVHHDIAFLVWDLCWSEAKKDSIQKFIQKTS